MEEYLGFKEVVMTDDEMAEFYSGSLGQLNEEKYSDSVLETISSMVENEYLIIKNEIGEVVDQQIYKTGLFIPVSKKRINSRYLGKVRARNVQQNLAYNMLYDSNITVNVITGAFGTGKDFVMTSAAVDMLENNKFDKIVWIRNNIEVKDSKPLGYLPGDSFDKLLPFAMPLADHLGGVDGLKTFMMRGAIEIVHLGHLRGRDFRHSIIMCSEAENLTVEHVQLLIGRVSEGSELWLNGDFNQVDGRVFSEKNGMARAIDRLKGHHRFGHVKLLKTERSETAQMASLLD